MLNIQPDSIYVVEVPRHNNVISIRGPFPSYEEAEAWLEPILRASPNNEQILYAATGTWLIETAAMECDTIDPVNA